VPPASVGECGRRFAADRLAGLGGAPRLGAARTVADDTIESVLVDTLESAPPGVRPASRCAPTPT
jgi:hypothetical protein